MSQAWDEIKALHKQSTFGAKEGLAFKYFSRPLASLILYFIKNSRVTPNQITILSLIVGIAGSIVHMTIWTWWGASGSCTRLNRPSPDGRSGLFILVAGPRRSCPCVS